MPYWLSTVEVSRVQPELQDKLTVYRRWVIEWVFEAFQRETGIGQTTATAPVARDDETLSLAHIRDMGRAIAAFATQQIAFYRTLYRRSTSDTTSPGIGSSSKGTVR